MDIEKEFKALVTMYATFNEETQSYVSEPFNKETLLKLDENFNKLINKVLLADGPEEELLEINKKKLWLLLHPDRKYKFIPEVKWLEHTLSEGRNDGVCFKTLSFCFEKLTDPKKFKEIKFENVTNREELKQWLENLKNEAETYSVKSFYESLIGLLDQAGGYLDEVGNIKPKGIRMLMTFFPIIFASYGAILFSEQLFAVYAMYFIILKGGQYLECNTQLKAFGRTLQEVSFVSATASTAMLVRLLEMTFWASHQCYDATLKIGSAILTPLIQPGTHGVNYEKYASANLCRELILAGDTSYAGLQYDNPELKLISAPLEAYLGLNAKQFLVSWRAGGTKRSVVGQFLSHLRALDQLSAPLEKKLEEAKEKLSDIKEDKKVYIPGSGTALAVDQANNAIKFLTEEPHTIQLLEM